MTRNGLEIFFKDLHSPFDLQLLTKNDFVKKTKDKQRYMNLSYKNNYIRRIFMIGF